MKEKGLKGIKMKQRPLRILISNDDGVYAEGISVLRESLRKIAKVFVVAPDRDRSGASNSLTLTAPLRIKYLEPELVSVEGTPTDSVHIALTGLLEEQPDMVISGINAGANLGDDVWYSGTVAAAMEGRFLGYPAIAISLASERVQYYETAAKVAAMMIDQILRDPLPASTILNINVPDLTFDDLAGFEVARLGTRHCAQPAIKQIDPRGHPVYWIGAAGAEADSGPGTDFYAVRNHCVSITPLRIDLTRFEAFEQLAQWVLGLSNKNDEKV